MMKSKMNNNKLCNRKSGREKKASSLNAPKRIKISPESKKELKMLVNEDKGLYSENELKKDDKEFISSAFHLKHLLTKLKLKRKK